MIIERRSVSSNQSYNARITSIEEKLSTGLENGSWTQANSYTALNTAEQTSLKGYLERQS